MNELGAMAKPRGIDGALCLAKGSRCELTRFKYWNKVTKWHNIGPGTIHCSEKTWNLWTVCCCCWWFVLNESKGIHHGSHMFSLGLINCCSSTMGPLHQRKVQVQVLPTSFCTHDLVAMICSDWKAAKSPAPWLIRSVIHRRQYWPKMFHHDSVQYWLIVVSDQPTWSVWSANCDLSLLRGPKAWQVGECVLSLSKALFRVGKKSKPLP